MAAQSSLVLYTLLFFIQLSLERPFDKELERLQTDTNTLYKKYQENIVNYSFQQLPDYDESARCNRSRICEGTQNACIGMSVDNDLGCLTDNHKRLKKVRSAINWTYDAYKRYAFGKDELKPLSQNSRKWFDMGLTLVDSLDTLWVAGFRDEFNEGIDWIRRQLEFEKNERVSLFELNIRILAGLLSAFHLSGGDQVVGLKAGELGSRMLVAFRSDFSQAPHSQILLADVKALGAGNLAEIGTLSVEFAYLGRIVNFPELVQPAYKVYEWIPKTRSDVKGLWPVSQSSNVYSVGAMGDSFYEYLLKHWILTGKTDTMLLNMYKESVRGVRDHLLQNTDSDYPDRGLWYIAQRNVQIIRKMDHLTCFFPGLLALGYYHGIDTAVQGEASDLELAEQLTYTCYMMYKTMPSGLAPESVRFIEAASGYGPRHHNALFGGGYMEVDMNMQHNFLRPETVESLFVLYRITKKNIYREWGWQIFRAFEMHAKVESGGYATVLNVLQTPTKLKDQMESFWLSETLKYMFLLFSDEDFFPIDEYIFNTEAHPIPIFGSEAEKSFQSKYLSNIWKESGLDLRQSNLLKQAKQYKSLVSLQL